MPKCIFCPRTNLTHEHILSDFLHSILVGADFREEAYDGMAEVDGELKYVVIPPKPQQGGVHTKTAYCICEDCNNGWMGRIVSAASYWAKPLVMSKAIELDEIKQRQLASWIGLTAITADWIGRARFKLSQEDRNFMFAHGVPPPHWTIDIGRWEGPLTAAISQNPLFMLAGNKTTEYSLKLSLHSISTIQGGLYSITNIISPSSAPSLPVDCYPPFLVRLWPVEQRVLHWPLIKNSAVTGQFYEGTIAYELSRRMRDQLQAGLEKMARDTGRI
jgi:hypothetical protein